MTSCVPEVIIWQGSHDDVDLVVPILSESHGRPVDSQWVLQKMCRAEEPTIAALAVTEGRVCGIVAFGLTTYSYGAQRVRVGLSFDTYVAPPQRGQGLFMRLLEAAESAAKAGGTELLLNFPNGNSRPGFAKAGWQPLEPMTRFIRPSGRLLRSFPEGVAKFSRSRSSYLNPIEANGLREDEIACLVGSDVPVAPLRMLLNSESTANRFHSLRGRGYVFVTSAKSSAVAVGRVGMRGSIKELQVLVYSPRLPRARDIKRLADDAGRAHDADVVTMLSSSKPSQFGAAVLAGFVPMRASTIPYVKPLGSGIELESYCLSGVDIHTW